MSKDGIEPLTHGLLVLLFSRNNQRRLVVLPIAENADGHDLVARNLILLPVIQLVAVSIRLNDAPIGPDGE